MEKPLPRRSVKDGIGIKEPGKDTVTVAVKSRIRQVVCKGGNGSGGIVAHAGHLPQTFKRVWHLAVPLPQHTGGTMEVARSGIVPQPLPAEQHIVLIYLSKRTQIGKTAHKTQIIVHTLRDTRLLKDYLADPYTIRVCRITPRQYAMVLVVPAV